MERKRDLSQICVVVDMDMYFAAVEIRDNPSLKDKPVAVGSKYMISTTNYVARKYGVRSAMPGFIAQKLCPTLVFVKPNYEKYKKASMDVFPILQKYDPSLSSMSLDEAYMNITKAVKKRKWEILQQRTKGSLEANRSLVTEDEKEISDEVIAESLVNEMRAKVLAGTGLTCSAGIGPTTMIAKIAADQNKPNGQYLVANRREEVLEFIHSLKVRKVPGIGKVTEKLLNDGFKIETVKELYEKRYEVFKLMTPAIADYLLRVSMGYGSAVSAFTAYSFSDGDRKSISIERTFPDIQGTEIDKVKKKCMEVCELLVADMKKEKIMGRLVTVKVKSASFQVRNKQMNCHRLLGTDARELYHIAFPILKSLKIKDMRLLGVKVSDLKLDATDEENDPLTGLPTGGQNNRKQHFLDQFVGNMQKRKRKRIPASDSSLLMKEENVVGAITLNCPSCGHQLHGLTNESINNHLDNCLELKTRSSSDPVCIEIDISQEYEPNLPKQEPIKNYDDASVISINSFDSELEQGANDPVSNDE